MAVAAEPSPSSTPTPFPNAPQPQQRDEEKEEGRAAYRQVALVKRFARLPFWPIWHGLLIMLLDQVGMYVCV